MQLLDDFKAFLEDSPTSWHAALQLGNRLASKDFIPIDEEEKWELKAGSKYFVQRDGSLCAFSLPSSKPERGVILGAHTDSPALKLKPKPEISKENMMLLGVEIYGAPMLSSWLNRDLGIAGRVVVADKEGAYEEKLIIIDDAPVFIPQLAIHLDREVNEKGLLLNKQDHLSPVASLKSKMETSYLETLIRKQLSFHSLVSFDLLLFPLEECRFLGADSEMLASYRLDNLASCHAAVTAMASAKSPQKDTLQMAFFWDHEEIGSRSREGAGSPFFEETLKRICNCLKMDEEDYFRLKGNSLFVSIDMAQGFNPNYAAKYEVNHSSFLGKGITIKYNADQKYASSASSAAPVITACRQLSLPYQSHVGRSDIPSGSTVGPIVAASTGIKTVDIGCPQLAMHAAREVMACSDHLDMCQILTHLLEEK